jgi:hypothetical protein
MIREVKFKPLLASISDRVFRRVAAPWPNGHTSAVDVIVAGAVR